MRYFWVGVACLFSSTVWAAEGAGEVIFTAGTALVRHAGSLQQVKRGDKIAAGDTLETGDNGYIQIRTVDQGFVSLRPSSRLTIEQYQYHPDSPRSNAIKFQLQQGVMRSVTGKGGEAAKDRFRLNTPVAAIGIRGTDFSVYATPAETRVNIRLGEVVVSPFNTNCLATALGPCNGSSVQNLAAGNMDQVLRVRQQDAKPVLLLDHAHKLAPDALAPALPEESANTSAAKTAAPVSVNALLPGDSTLADVTQNTALASVNPPDTAPPVPAPVLAQLEWGRWGTSSSTNTAYALLTPDREIIAWNSLYLLTRTRDSMALPEQGSFSFNLAGGEAGILNNFVKVGDATISNGALMVDFGKSTYSTSLTLTAPSLATPLSLYSNNTLSPNGKFGGGLLNGNMSVTGALSGNGTSAGYLFSSPLSDGRVVEGITTWTKR